MPFANIKLVVTPTEFRSDFPEFEDATIYLTSTINYWLSVASFLLNAERFIENNTLILATECFVAHQMVLEAQASAAAKLGGWPGISKGAISAEGAGDVNLSYEVPMTLEEDAGNYNLTTYGTRFWQLANMAGMGPIQVGPGGPGIGIGFGGAGTVPGASLPGKAYSGPNTLPGISTFGS